MTNVQNTYEERFKQRLDDYAKDYRVEELNQSNDRAQLRMLISAELMLEALQKEIETIIGSEDLIDKANEVKKLSDLIRDATENVTKIQRTLAIDRKTRKTEETDNFAGYIRQLKREAKKFVEDRLIRIYCTHCKVMVARFSAVHDHTAFTVEVQCSQCGKFARAKRQDKDIWFDLKADAEWRRKYPVEIINPSQKEGFTASDFTADVEDEYVIEGGEIIDGISTTP